MARVLISQMQPEIKGAGLLLTLGLVFYGPDVPNESDSTVITIELPGTMSKATWRTRIKDAITAEAGRLGYDAGGTVTLLAELVLGL